MSKNYYDLLGVSPTADDFVIAAAYKALMRKYHPDANGGSKGAQEKAKLLNQAYSVLSNPEKRAEYDTTIFGSNAGQRQASKKADEQERTTESESFDAPVISKPAKFVRDNWGFFALAMIVITSIGVGNFNAPDRYAQTDAMGDAEHYTDYRLVDEATEGAEAIKLVNEVSEKNIAKALSEFRSVLGNDGILGAAEYSESCFEAHKKAPTWKTYDFCVAFDIAASIRDSNISSLNTGEEILYFSPDLASQRKANAFDLLDGSSGEIFRDSKIKSMIQKVALEQAAQQELDDLREQKKWEEAQQREIDIENIVEQITPERNAASEQKLESPKQSNRLSDDQLNAAANQKAAQIRERNAAKAKLEVNSEKN